MKNGVTESETIKEMLDNQTRDDYEGTFEIPDIMGNYAGEVQDNGMDDDDDYDYGYKRRKNSYDDDY